MTLPTHMTATHVKILRTLAQAEERKYLAFRFEANPWRRESYFDAQVKWMSNLGFGLLTGTKTIQITKSGKELVQREAITPPLERMEHRQSAHLEGHEVNEQARDSQNK